MRVSTFSTLREEYSKNLQKSNDRLRTLVEVYNSDKKLLEGRQEAKLKSLIIAEAIKNERLHILAEAAGAKPEELKEHFFGMLGTLVNLSNEIRCPSLKSRVNELNSNAENLMYMSTSHAASAKKFMAKVADAAILTKGFLTLATSIVDEGNDPVGQTIASIKMTDKSGESKIATLLSKLGKTKKTGFFGRSKEVHHAENFVNDAKKTVSRKSPGFLKVLGDENFNDFMQCIFSVSPKYAQKVMNTYVNETMDVVDDEFLLKMAKPGFFGTLKNIGDLISGGSGSARI